MERLRDIAERLEALGADTAVTRASRILGALQFSPEMLHRPSKEVCDTHPLGLWPVL